MAMCAQGSRPGAPATDPSSCCPLRQSINLLLTWDTCASSAGDIRWFCGSAYFMAWRYYDFDANWDKVYKAWQGDAVQDALEPDVEEWCEQAYYTDAGGHKVHPTWHRGDSLWQCSRSSYWPGRNCEAANNLMQTENVAKQLLAAVRRSGFDITMEQLCGRDDLTGPWHRAWDKCERRCKPQRVSCSLRSS